MGHKCTLLTDSNIGRSITSLFLTTKNYSEEIAEELRCRMPLGISYKEEKIKKKKKRFWSFLSALFLSGKQQEVTVQKPCSRWMSADAIKGDGRVQTDSRETGRPGNTLALAVHFPVGFLNWKCKFVELTKSCFSFFKAENYLIQSLPSNNPKQILKRKP